MPRARIVSRFICSYMLRMLPRQSRVYDQWKQILAYHVANPQPRRNFRDTFKSCSEDCCNLLSDMLQIDDRIRATAAQCYRHLPPKQPPHHKPKVCDFCAPDTRSSSPMPQLSAFPILWSGQALRPL
jgi:hypothetical protein